MSYQARVRYQSQSIAIPQFRLPGLLAGAAIRTLILFSVVALLAGYFSQISSLTTGGYKIKDLEKQKVTISDENERLKAEIASYQSMNSVKKRLESMGMVKAENIKYIKVGDGPVAKY